MRRSYGYDRVVGYERDVLTFISFTAAFLEAGENLSTYITWKRVHVLEETCKFTHYHWMMEIYLPASPE